MKRLVKIALSQNNYHAMDFKNNYLKIKNSILSAKIEGASIRLGS